jgi:two-component system nitrate/nitrite response regulator NarL
MYFQMSVSRSSIRIIILDAHTLVRDGLRAFLESKPGMLVVGQAGDQTQALEIAKRAKPDIILLELNLGESTLDFIPELLAAAKSARLILVTSVMDASTHYQAIQFGAVGIVSKEQPADILRKAIDKVYAGQAWLDRSTTAQALTRMSRSHSNGKSHDEDSNIAALSPREREVIEALCRGLKNQDIADSLSLSETTVRHHLTSVFAKLHVSDRLELIVYAYRNHLVEMPR